ncbi:hypothetical protein NHQ30_002523 [Ciborinia camelliae]|nr:hypothetical protein NHQ30_002523 [Ciborinia camelliae]
MIIVLSWGIIASLQSIATSFAGLIVLRTLLGIGEAGFTGIPFYLSFFFKREELAFRTGIFLSAAPLATSFASSLAWGIVKLGKHSPIAPWRLLFLVEGFPSVLAALFAWHHIPDSPNTAPYLSTREKKIARLRLRHEMTSTPHSKTQPSSGLQFKEVLLTFRDPKVYLTALMFFFSNMSFSSMPIFLPTILTHMGHSPSTSQALSAPPYLLSFLSVLLTSHLSDKLRARSPFLILHALLSSLGYILLSLPPAPALPHHPLPRHLPRLHRLLLRHHHPHHLDPQQPALVLAPRRRLRHRPILRPVRPPARHETLPRPSSSLLSTRHGRLRPGDADGGRAGHGLAMVARQGKSEELGAVREGSRGWGWGWGCGRGERPGGGWEIGYDGEEPPVSVYAMSSVEDVEFKISQTMPISMRSMSTCRESSRTESNMII